MGVLERILYINQHVTIINVLLKYINADNILKGRVKDRMDKPDSCLQLKMLNLAGDDSEDSKWMSPS